MQHSRRKGTCSNDQRRTQKPVGVTSCQFDSDVSHRVLTSLLRIVDPTLRRIRAHARRLRVPGKVVAGLGR